MYNRGDIKGCANLYRRAAQAALVAATEDEKKRLLAGLQSAGSNVPDKDAAWSLRYAFDDVLAGNGERRGDNRADGMSLPAIGIPVQTNSVGVRATGYDSARCLQGMQIVMGCSTFVFSLFFIPTLVEGEWGDSGEGRPMQSMEYHYAFAFFVAGCALGLTAATGGFLYFRAWGPGIVASVSFAAAIFGVADIVIVITRITSRLDVRPPRLLLSC